MQIKDTKYIIYAEGTMSQDGRTNALYQRKNGAPVYTYGAYADRFDKAEADRRTAYKGKYKWIARPVNDAEMISDYNRAAQENKLTSYSLEFRNKLRSAPEKAKSILFEAYAAYDNVVADTDEDDKKQVREAADKHWNDLQKFAESLKVSTKDKLIQSSSEEAFSKNVSTEIKAGKDPKQAAAIAYSIQKENDSSMKDGLNVIVKLNGRTYKGAFNGISGADKRFGDVYIPELVSLHSGDRGVFNPDEGNYVSDGKFYFKMENLKRWNPFLKDYIKDSDVTDAYPPNSFIYKGLERRIVLAAHDIAKLNALIDDVNRQFDLSKEERDKLVKLAQWYVSQKQQADSMKDSDTYQVWTINEAGKYQKEAEVTNPTAAKTIAQRLKQSGKWVQISKNNKTNILNDSAKENNSVIKDTKFLVNAYKDGKLLEERVVNTKAQAEQLATEFEKKYGEYSTSIKVIWDSNITDADPVKVEKIIRKEKSALGITYYLFQTKSNSGATIYYEVTDKTYHGEPTYSGGGVISFSLKTANDSLDSHLLSDKLKAKYGEKEGTKRYLNGENDSAIKDADMFNITFERNGVYQANLVRANSEEDAKQKFISYAKKHNLPEAKIISVGPNKEGYKPGKPVIDGESIKDAPPVDVLGIVQSKRDNTGKTWYLLSISTKSGNKGYLVTGEYDGGFHHSGGGAVSFNLNTAKADMDAFITIANLKSKYGEAEGYKRYMAGQKDSSSISSNKIKDFDPRILAVLENVGKKGDAWWNKWKNIFDMTKGWNSYDWVQLAKRDPKKHDMLLKNRELATKEAKSIDAEWNRAIDALSRESGRYGTDFSGYKNDVWTSNVVAASSERVKQIKNNIAENQAFRLERAKSRRDAMPVKVIAKKAMEMQDGCSRHYLEVEDCEGKRFYMVTDEYDGCSRQFAGSGSVIEDKALLNKKYKDDLASGLTSVGRSAILGAKEVKSKIEQASRDDAVDLEMYKKPLDNLMQCGQVKDGVSASKVDAMLGINDLDTTKQLLKDAGIKYSAVTSKVSQYKIVEGKCVKVEE